ncbi:MAG: 4Fe-4S dicluster domain-containing protein [Sulfurospirillum sp.]|nr:4Fe-4S dicluster domain-containing protein [Sulfurospirillum sp.]MBL0703541.1 4Fe-4S dicluster domain-containing protein [Sulfurospirillum sp.]
MQEKNTRREFLKKGAITSAFAILSSVQAEAFSLANPGIDAKNIKFTGDSTKKYVMVIDLRKCVGCQACTSSCIVENSVPQGQSRTSVTEMEIGEFPDVRKGFLPQLCNHCDEPSCVPVCPTGATFKREDGLVVIDNKICIGCGYCENTCPYDKRFINKETKVMDKCTFCAHRLQDGLLPACVETCVGGARIFGDLNNKSSEVYKLISNFPVDVLQNEQGTKPQVYYIGLDNRLEKIANATISLDNLVQEALQLEEKQWTTVQLGAR